MRLIPARNPIDAQKTRQRQSDAMREAEALRARVRYWSAQLRAGRCTPEELESALRIEIQDLWVKEWEAKRRGNAKVG